MTIVVFLKFFHYVSLFLAGGLGVANAMLYKNHQKAKTPPAPAVQKTMMALARLGLQEYRSPILSMALSI